MKIIKKRIGKDLSIKWPILTNGAAVSLSGRDLSLELINQYGESKFIPLSTNANKVIANFSNDMQSGLGVYTITLWENLGKSGQTAVDALAVELVDRSYKESVPTSTDVAIDSLDLDSSTIYVAEKGEKGDDATINGYNVVNLEGGTGTTVATTASGNTATITITATDANSDHTRAEADHSAAVSDHTKASSDHAIAESDHSRAESDHATAVSDHSTAVADHASIVSKVDKSYVDTELAKKQNTIADLDTIRSGAALGATAVQPETGKGLFSGNYNDLINKPTNVSSFANDAGYLTEHQDISGKADKATTYTKTEVNTELDKKQDVISDIDTIRSNASSALSKANEAEEIAKGRATGYVFDTKAAMDAWLANPENVAKLVLGDNLYIRAVDTPDYWWDGASAKELETQKVDLTEYAKKSELPTVPTKVSAFENDANYLTQHQDISGKADKATTYTKTEVDTALAAKADESELTTLGAQVSTHTGNTTVHITADERTAWNGKYTKPSGGVPKTDLASDVQTSLGKADTALQSLDAYGLTVSNGMLCVTY